MARDPCDGQRRSSSSLPAASPGRRLNLVITYPRVFTIPITRPGALNADETPTQLVDVTLRGAWPGAARALPAATGSPAAASLWSSCFWRLAPRPAAAIP